MQGNSRAIHAEMRGREEVKIWSPAGVNLLYFGWVPSLSPSKAGEEDHKGNYQDMAEMLSDNMEVKRQLSLSL